MNKDLISGVCLVAIAGTYYAWSTQIADSTLSDEVGAGGLPQILAILLGLLGIALIARTVVAARSRPAMTVSADEEEDYNARLPRAIGFLLFGAAYISILPFVGYMLATAFLIGAISLYEGAPRSWVVIAAALGGGALYWALFVKLLGVRQPLGSLFQGLFS